VGRIRKDIDDTLGRTAWWFDTHRIDYVEHYLSFVYLSAFIAITSDIFMFFLVLFLLLLERRELISLSGFVMVFRSVSLLNEEYPDHRFPAASATECLTD
jgi:hypothetical protein